ncbi:MAG: alpha-L-rhamnosidase, partial [Blautia sp.]|nr:alpha-L-rhamnosidase [Blautia sp.]
YTDTAYRLLMQEECPSWLYEVKKGATTIWETWDGIREDGTVHDSLNHYSYGSICGWLFGGVCGIRLQDRSLTISPKPGRALGHASARWDSPVGRIESSWRYEGDRVVYEIEVPVPATISLPGREEILVPAGRYGYEVPEAVSLSH